MSIEILIYLFFGVAIGAVIGWLMGRQQAAGQLGTIAQLNTQLEQTRNELKEKYRESEELIRDLATSEGNVEHYHEKLRTRDIEINDLQTKFKEEFENLANRLLEEKSKKFAEQNLTGLQGLLQPLQEKILGFENKIQNVHVEDTKQRSSLTEQIKYLAELNEQMSQDAKNLTRALKSDNKMQGNWGELILEKILEKSGLTKGREYIAQQSLQDEDQRKRQPDIVIHLPDNKHLIIDSKVSLVAFEKFVSAENDHERDRSLKEHINSLRNHIRMLSDKNYPALEGLNSPDFVMLFVPLEPAFSIALQQDQELMSEAFEKNIIVVSPTTLLATARTVANLWRQENRNRNAQEIARYAGDLYDKFVLFIQDLEQVGERLQQATKSYDGAINKLSTGRGNLIGKAERLREMGAKTSKHIPPNLLEE